ncbi:uncharacterized protein TM35_000401490 [Trypanosoma theileri]|uniref:Uncharacterized protein n=1 Tax=Trypanosoma theileri TaxID=67003 RepID=A0A1X0NJF3_9TRYP|nr:uncharacterized protein TM35_000401490 [Trypanosoma theileri]ORC84882.1 hypothetical protein TM35_000401490 [Trypanosoma theileri]
MFTPDDSSSSPDDNSVSVNKKATSRRTMRSLFAEDALQSKQGVTSLRYEDKSATNKTVSLNVMGKNNSSGDNNNTYSIPPNAPSPLQTASQAVVLTYKGENSLGPCVVALCVPHINASITVPLIAIVDREKRPQCRVRLDENLQFLQNKSEPQYASLYDPTFDCHWTLMFKGRRECTEFVAAAQTSLHCTDIGNNEKVPYINWYNKIEEEEKEGESTKIVSRGDVVSVSFMIWLLRRVPGTRFFSLGKLIEEVPPEAPREIVVGEGTMMIGIEESLLGMSGSNSNDSGSGTSRLVFVPPQKTQIWKGIGNPEVTSTDSIVVHITCHDVISRCTGGSGGNSSSNSNSRRPVITDDFGNRVFKGNKRIEEREIMHSKNNTPPVEVPMNPTTGIGDTNMLLQAFLLQTLQQQQLNNKNVAGLGNSTTETQSTTRWDVVERSLERVQLQLSSLYEKIDRLGIDEKIEKNNLAIERIVKKAIGKAPVNDVDIEDMVKDRDGLLAVIERLKVRLEEESSNYHRALEAMGRHKDDLHRMQNDIRIQEETHTTRMRELEEQRRLQLVEAEVRHRQALERVSEEKFREGQDAGFKAGVKVGRQEAHDAAGTHSEMEWKERVFASEQRVVLLESEMQEKEGHHIAERRRLQEQIDALQDMLSRLEKREEKTEGQIISQFGPDIISKQCKTLRRALNATYTNIETQLCALNEETVRVEDVLQMVLFAVRSEAHAFTDEIKKEAALQSERIPPVGDIGERLATLLNAQGESASTAEKVGKEVVSEDGNDEVVKGKEEQEPNFVMFPPSHDVTTEIHQQKQKDDFLDLGTLPPAPPQMLQTSAYNNADVFPDPPELLLTDDNYDKSIVSECKQVMGVCSLEEEKAEDKNNS